MKILRSKATLDRSFLSALIAVLCLLTLTAPTAYAQDEKRVSQESVLKLTPELLSYDNMAAGVPVRKELTVTNTSDSKTTISPFIDLSEKYGKYIRVIMLHCPTDKCELVSAETTFSLKSGESLDLLVEITLSDDTPKGLFAKINTDSPGEVKIRGTIFEGPDGTEAIIVPRGDPADPVRPPAVDLPALGSTSSQLIFLGLGFTFIGFVLILVNRKNKEHERQDNS